jgi:hypothetical protein
LKSSKEREAQQKARLEGLTKKGNSKRSPKRREAPGAQKEVGLKEPRTKEALSAQKEERPETPKHKGASKSPTKSGLKELKGEEVQRAQK